MTEVYNKQNCSSNTKSKAILSTLVEIFLTILATYSLSYSQITMTYDKSGNRNTILREGTIPKIPIINGQDRDITFLGSESETYTYNVTNNDRSNYNWRVVNGRIIGDEHLSEIDIVWQRNSEGLGYLYLIETNFVGCSSDTAKFTIGLEKPLPVSLINFKGKHTSEGNILNWTTTSEVNNDYFAIERSTNGITFIQIGVCFGNGSSSTSNYYSFTDNNYPEHTSYYRLKQVDYNGEYSYSRIIAIDPYNINKATFYPNPVQSLINIELPDHSFQKVNIMIVNSRGQQVVTRNNVESNYGNLKLNLSELTPGIYVVAITSEKNKYNLSVLKL